MLVDLFLCDMLGDAMGSTLIIAAMLSVLGEGGQYAVMYFDMALQLQIGLFQSIEAIHFVQSILGVECGYQSREDIFFWLLVVYFAEKDRVCLSFGRVMVDAVGILL